MATTRTVELKKGSKPAPSRRRVAPKPAPEPEPEDEYGEDITADGIVIELDDEEQEELRLGGIPVRLVGQDYTVHPPKMAMALRLGRASKAASKSDDPDKIAEVLGIWMEAAFGKRISKDVQKRLDDPDDLIDYPHIMRLIDAVVRYQAQSIEDSNPPT